MAEIFRLVKYYNLPRFMFFFFDGTPNASTRFFSLSPGLTLKKHWNSSPYIEHHMVETSWTCYIPRKRDFRRCWKWGAKYSAGPEASCWWSDRKIDNDRLDRQIHSTAYCVVIYVCMYVCIFIHIYIYTYIYIYIYIYILYMYFFLGMRIESHAQI